MPPQIKDVNAPELERVRFTPKLTLIYGEERSTMARVAHGRMALLSALALALPLRAADPPTRQSCLDQARACRQLLKSSLVSFYLPACIDPVHGGYFESLRDGRFVATGEKFLVQQARQLWFFSTLAQEGVEKQPALAAAKLGFDFLERNMRDRSHGGYFSKVTDAGKVHDSRKHAYHNAFALYGLVAYYQATQDAAALAAAKELFGVLEAKAHDRRHGGYLEFFYDDWRPIEDRKEPIYVGAIGTKTYNTHLHLMEAFAALYRVWPEPLVRQRLVEMLFINVNTVRHPIYWCNIDAWTPNWRMVETPNNIRASYGHDVECVWLALDAARTAGIPEHLLRNWADSVCGYVLQFGFDRSHGGFFYSGPPGKPADETKKEWWVQAEALVGMLEIYRLTGNVEYYDAFRRTFAFVDRHQVAREGGWWASLSADGTPLNDQRSSPWHGAYHSGRSLLHCAALVDQLATTR
jgi:mannobiose 2-epimerase